MAPSKPSLDIPQDLSFERRQWRVQRVGWALMALVLLLALVGLFGKGPLSHTSQSGGELTVEYDRFLHSDAPGAMRIAARHLSGKTARLRIDRAYIDAMDFQGMQPLPTLTESSADGVILQFAVDDSHELHVTIDVNPQSPGMPTGVIQLLDAGDASSVAIRQLIYP